MANKIYKFCLCINSDGHIFPWYEEDGIVYTSKDLNVIKKSCIKTLEYIKENKINDNNISLLNKKHYIKEYRRIRGLDEKNKNAIVYNLYHSDTKTYKIVSTTKKRALKQMLDKEGYILISTYSGNKNDEIHLQVIFKNKLIKDFLYNFNKKDLELLKFYFQ